MITTAEIIKVHLENLRNRQSDVRREHSYHQKRIDEAKTRLTILAHEIVNLEIWRLRNESEKL